ncbi:fatty acid desaturase [Schlesneria paludicola]|uniref:fatty acid desaturase n=1 Tax=Schlesneria paludicola TaxID=360056 RepID=UPI00029A4BAB|nr:fatty acid desaturase [Schlesneria paludicola]
MGSENAPNLDAVDMGTAALPGRNVLEISVLRSLSIRSDLQGYARFGAHFGCMALTGILIWMATPNWYLMIPAMMLHGFTIVTMFAPMHECVHKTAFATPLLNEIFGWIAGLLSFYNFTYYRYYHTWHHRYTQDPERDPELMSPKPRNVWEYLVEISAITFWCNRPLMFIRLATGQTGRYPFVPENARRKIAISASIQLGVYATGLVSIALGHTAALYYFFLPVLLAQPLLRAILLAEHTGCTYDENGLTNTRTTLTNFPIRLLMWNMPYHTEHHLYPSIPFYQLPRAHDELKTKLAHLAPSYVVANQIIIRALAQAKQEA